MVTADQIRNPNEMDYQFGKPLDVWSGALWLGAALEALIERARDGDETARVWLDRTPAPVKAQWPGLFSEFPYEGESRAEHAERLDAEG